jgi:hypothetical protein
MADWVSTVREEAPMTVTGLRQRLENLEGVASIHLELAETGLSGIRVTLMEGADEAHVLEKIRSMLVTYGLRSPGRLEADTLKSVTEAAKTDHIETSITPEGDGMRVEVRGEGRSVVRLVDATPLAAAVAVAEGRAILEGKSTPQVLWIGLDIIGDWKILTVLVKSDGETARVGSAVVTSGWAEALDEAVAKAS